MFNAKNHPKVISGEITEDQVFAMFLKNFSDKSYPKQHPKYKEIIEKLKSIHNERNIEDPDKETKGRKKENGS